MMKRKRLPFIALALAAGLLAGGCGPSLLPGEGGPALPPASEQTAPAAAATTDSERPREPAELQFYGNNNYLSLASSPDGIYLMDSVSLGLDESGYEQYASRMAYIDVASGRQVFLCPRPDCRHTDASCQAAPPGDMGGMMFFAEGALYMLYGDSARRHSPFEGMVVDRGGGQQAPSSCLYRMNPDGSNPRMVLNFPEEYLINSYTFAFGGGELFVTATEIDFDKLAEIQEQRQKDMEKQLEETGGYTSSSVDPADYAKRYVLMAMDTATGQYRIVAALSERHNFLGLYQNSLLLSEDTYVIDPDGEGWADWSKSTSQMFALDPYTGERTNLRESSMNDSGTLIGETLYLSSGRGSIWKYDFATGEKLLVTDQMPSGPYYFSCWADGMLSCVYYEEKYHNPRDTGVYVVNLETGEVRKGLVTPSWVAESTIHARAGDWYYVTSDKRVEVNYISWAGVYQDDVVGTDYALIHKDDYWAARPGYRPIEVIR